MKRVCEIHPATLQCPALPRSTMSTKGKCCPHPHLSITLSPIVREDTATLQCFCYCTLSPEMVSLWNIRRLETQTWKPVLRTMWSTILLCRTKREQKLEKQTDRTQYRKESEPKTACDCFYGSFIDNINTKPFAWVKHWHSAVSKAELQWDP